MENDLRLILYYLGKYLEKKEIPGKEWMTFSVNLMRKEKGIISFTSPSLTMGIANTNEVSKEDDAIIINEFKFYDGE